MMFPVLSIVKVDSYCGSLLSLQKLVYLVYLGSKSVIDGKGVKLLS
jgi:hypothetical protein